MDHGPPGTGKTAFISALANFLQRAIVIVDVSNIKTKTQMDKIMRQSPPESVILVFEEVDIMAGVGSRVVAAAAANKSSPRLSLLYLLPCLAPTRKRPKLWNSRRERRPTPLILLTC